MDTINNFLRKFHVSTDVDEVFSGDCCYWFAVILFRRFIKDGAEIVCSTKDSHFGTKIHGRVYDITGDVTAKYKWETWIAVKDGEEKESIIKNRIIF